MSNVINDLINALTLGMVIYLVAWTLTWFKESVQDIQATVHYRSRIQACEMTSLGEAKLIDKVSSLEKELKEHYWEQVKDVDYAVGDTLTVRGQQCRITDITDSVGREKKQVITITTEGVMNV